MATLWLRLYKINGSEIYRTAAVNDIKFVAHTQNLVSTDPNIRGAIAGSSPRSGKYERFKYPNWAAKFFLDALLLIEMIDNNLKDQLYIG